MVAVSLGDGDSLPGEAHETYNDAIPWRVRAHHNQHVLVKRLRLNARHASGAEIRPDQLALLDRWLAYMRENDAVVCYDRDEEDGFYLDHRRDGDGALTRPPLPGQGR